jgi:PAS domain S-box-containing protein
MEVSPNPGEVAGAKVRSDHPPRQIVADSPEFAQLKHELELRNWALDAATTHFTIIDMRRRGWPILFVNRALAHDHGYERHELLGRSLSSLLSPENDPESVAEINDAMRVGTPLRRELRSLRKDGSIFWSGVALAPIRDAAGGITHYTMFGADITARMEEKVKQERLQRQLYEEMQERERMAIELRFAQKLESVGRLAAGIAHEINTPIQYVGDGVRFLQSAMADIDSLLGVYRAVVADLVSQPNSRDDIARIRQAEATADLDFLKSEVPQAFERTLDGVARVAGIVRAMKEFAHPDVNEQAMADLNHAIETTLTVARGEYKYWATIETRYTELPEVLCNVGELNQVFLNLIVNAAHAIEQSGKDSTSGRISISSVSDGQSVTIVIADNGCGIPAENLERIFDPFFTTKEVGRGTGQGLAIARSIVVDKHGGSIEAQSAVGQGTRFILKLPIGGRASGSAGAIG